MKKGGKPRYVHIREKEDKERYDNPHEILKGHDSVDEYQFSEVRRVSKTRGRNRKFGEECVYEGREETSSARGLWTRETR